MFVIEKSSKFGLAIGFKFKKNFLETIDPEVHVLLTLQYFLTGLTSYVKIKLEKKS